MLLLCAASHDRRWLIYLFNCLLCKRKVHGDSSISSNTTNLNHTHTQKKSTSTYMQILTQAHAHDSHSSCIYYALHATDEAKKLILSHWKLPTTSKTISEWYIIHFDVLALVLGSIMCAHCAHILQRIITVLWKLHWRAHTILTNRLYVNAVWNEHSFNAVCVCVCVCTESRFLSWLTINAPGKNMFVTNRYIRIRDGLPFCYIVLAIWLLHSLTLFHTE